MDDRYKTYDRIMKKCFPVEVEGKTADTEKPRMSMLT